MEYFMKYILALFILYSTSIQVQASAILEENLYIEFKEEFEVLDEHQNVQIPFLAFEQSLLVDAYWDSLQEGVTPQKIKNLFNIQSFYFGVIERLRLSILKIKYGKMRSLDTILHDDLLNELRKTVVEKRLIYILAAHESLLLTSGYQYVIDLARKHEAYFDIAQMNESKGEVVPEIVTDLYFNSPDVSTYMEGEYIKSVKIFMFCRQNRLYPCLMVMRDIYGIEVRKEDGSLWSNPALASARTGLSSYQRNGNTPAGVFSIDSVMPFADQQLSYGKFRRLILNFVPKSNNEILIKSLLPRSSWDNNWWSSTVIARDIGRNLFRIHGSGKLNTDPTTTYYPFRRTLGCISQRENTYGEITYKDQRDLLDSIMTAMELTPSYQNETKVKGILYALEINDKQSPVTLDDLAEFGIK
jgi:hypothetical protein